VNGADNKSLTILRYLARNNMDPINSY
jgi:hypothetical protein